MKYGGGGYGGVLLLLVLAIAAEMGSVSSQSTLTCLNRRSSCFRKKIRCPSQCPYQKPSDPTAKACFLDCYSPKCEVVCKYRKPNCNGQGAGCYDPRFVGGDGVMFYFHGRKGGHFALVSEPRFQINARFIGLRPAGRSRDFTWIQALGFIFGPGHRLSVEATTAAQWDDDVDHFRFTYNGEPLVIPEGHRSEWKASDGGIAAALERTGRANSAIVTLEGLAEVSINAVPVTEEDDRIHNYRIPAGDRFVHLEVQFRFSGLSPGVEGVLGRTYQPDYVSPAKRGVAMPVLGGEDKYGTASLLSPTCKLCVFSPSVGQETSINLALPVAEN
ncbi:hypothetical protein Taro_016212 [Colocasia esculenta]|uniref:Uncharacterized protein n=1 Tax=Colocasia esculenta TaxID=4460 RepID=A0A843UJQ4_COLES|nr:hypothetical protein [Colocasia esculenta]